MKRIMSIIASLTLLIGLSPVYCGTIVKAETAVGTFDELTTALADTNVTEITLSADITATAALTISRNVAINGAGHTISAVTTGLNEQGIVQSNSSGYNIFAISSGTVNFNDLTILGGGDSAIAVANTAKLTGNNIRIMRSYPCQNGAGGGAISNGGTVILINSAIIRNAAAFAGGISNEGSLILDKCSLSENRSLGYYANGLWIGAGGGAIENRSKGKCYINNTVISNNTSSEIGGAINNNGSTLYLMNSTITGNATTCTHYGISCGGGIGNNSGSVYAVNSIISDNTYINGSTVSSSDIGMFNDTNTIKLSNCIFGSVFDSNGNQNKDYDSGNIVDGVTGANVFAGYRSFGVLSGSGTSSTTAYSHPILTSTSDKRLYAPLLNSGSKAKTGGAYATYFDYSDSNNVKMSYIATEGGAETALGILAKDGTQVATYIEGGTRTRGIIGASSSATENTTYYTVTVSAPANGTVTGGSVYGDTYVGGTSVTLNATENSGYAFTGWYEGDTFISADNPYTFNVSKDITLTAKFAEAWNVSITAGIGMSTNGKNLQNVEKTKSVTDVTYTADAGYYFPENYVVNTVNNVSVTRISASQIKVSGTPTADTAITLLDATPKTSITVSVKLDDWTYDKIAKNPSLVEGSNPGNGNVIYTYYTDEACTVKTTTGSGASFEGGQPVNAGAYYVKADVTETTNYSKGSGSKKFTITPKTIGINWGSAEFTYNGSEQMPTATATGVIDGDTCSITVTGGQTNAGTGYTATASSVNNSNYKLPTEKTKSFKIGEANITVSVKLDDWTYDKIAKNPSLVEGSNPGNGNVTYTYYTNEACTVKTTSASGASSEGGQPVNAGVYYVKADVAATENYSKGSGSKKFTITPKTIGINWEDTALFTYNGTEQKPAATATGVIDGDICSIIVTGGQTNVGPYIATASSLSNSNYKLPTYNLTYGFVISKAAISVTVKLDGWKYEETANTPSLAEGSNPGSGTVTYTYYTDAACKAKTTTASGASIEGGQPANAGTYYVKADVAKTDNYNAGSGSTKFAITKTLESIAITTAPTKTQYLVGDRFNPENMVVTAIYNDGSTKTVTEYMISPNRALSLLDTKVTISYAEDGVTRTVSQPVAVHGALTIEAGAGGTHKQGDDGALTITCTGVLDQLTAIKVEGAVLDQSNYTTENGSTILTLKASYLNTLSVGTYNLEFDYTYGSASSTFKIIPMDRPTMITDGKDKINGTTAKMEYSLDQIIWKTCTEESTAVTAGTYYVRYAATDSKNASEAVKVTVTATVTDDEDDDYQVVNTGVKIATEMKK
jgi:uncharacterized repeat protein (TIGR02543 family)